MSHQGSIEFLLYLALSYDVAGIQWIMLCHKIRMTTCVITLWRNIIDSVSVNSAFLIEIIIILKAIKSHFKESYDLFNSLNFLDY